MVLIDMPVETGDELDVNCMGGWHPGVTARTRTDRDAQYTMSEIRKHGDGMRRRFTWMLVAALVIVTLLSALGTGASG